MQLKLVVDSMFTQLKNMLSLITDQTYVSPVAAMSGSTIGEHTRHIIEFYLELMKGYESGVVNYDRRKRDHQVETDRFCAMEKMESISALLADDDKVLSLVSNFGHDQTEAFITATNYTRELIYNLEHTVHHMALIRVAITSLTDLALPPEFGVAAATLQFRESCVQ